MLPGIDGLEVCRRLKSQKETMLISIIMITAKGEEVDKIIGLELEQMTILLNLLRAGISR